MAVYAVSLSSGLSVALPKYSFPLLFARLWSFTVAVDDGADEEVEDVPVPEVWEGADDWRDRDSSTMC